MTFKFILGITSIVLTSGTILSEHDFSICQSSSKFTEHLFRQWMKKYDIEFADIETYAQRHNIFLDNYKYIEEHNADSTQTFKMAMNQFGHLTSEEWKAMYTGGYEKHQKTLRGGNLFFRVRYFK